MNKPNKLIFAIRIVFIVIAMAILVMPLLFINKEKNAISEREKRALKAFPETWTDTKDFTEQFTGWLNDNIGFRDQLLTLRTEIMFNLLGIVTGESVHKGEDDWYFYTLDENLRIATGEYTLNEDTLRAILENHLAIRDKLADRGIEYVIILPTSKVSIYPEYLGFGQNDIRETPVDIVADYIESNSDLRVVKLKQALIDEKKNHQIYFKHDTHWNQRGAYCAYRKIISDLNNWGLIGTSPIEVNFVEGEYIGEFGAMLGDPMLLGMEKTDVMDTGSFHAQKVQNDKYFALENVLTARGFSYPWYYYKNDNLSAEPSVMFYGDSMFGSWNATEALAENFSELCYIWSNDIFSDAIDVFEPDIVIFEMTERYLNQFPYKNSEFLLASLDSFSAKVQSFDYNEESQQLSVTILNDSTSSWRGSNLIRCSLWQNESDVGRAYLPVGETVEPGESVTFTFEGISESFFFDNFIEVQMVQEGITYFGERKTINGQNNNILDAQILSHTAPSTVNHTDSYTIDITVKNTGNTSWTEENGIRLCIWQDGIDYGYRVTLSENETVEPGEEHTFTLTGFVLPELPSTTLEFQMVREGITYFGKKDAVNISAEE